MDNSWTRRQFISSLLGVALFVLIGAPVARSQEAAPPSKGLEDALKRIDAIVDEEFAKDPIGSVTVGVVVGSKLVWTKSVGLANMEDKVKATDDTVYRIGSITKQFTGLMLMQLVEEGKVRLSDPVEKYLPEVNKLGNRQEGAPPITMVQLATMTAGLAREPQNLRTYLVGPVSEWENVMIRALEETSYTHEPDTRYQYSNIGYAILGAASARAAGKPFTEFVTERTFKPLGMAHTAFEPNEVIRPFISRGYARRRGSEGVSYEASEREHEGRGYKVPNGAIYTTVKDLAKFLSFELGEGPETVLKTETLNANFSRVNSSSDRLNSGYGVGFMLSRRGENIFHGHGGSVAGFNAAAHVNRRNGTGVVALRNVGGGATRVGTIANRALDELARAVPNKQRPGRGRRGRGGRGRGGE